MTTNVINENNDYELEKKVEELDNLIFPYFIDATKEKVLEIQEWCDGNFDIEMMRNNLKQNRAVLARKLLVDIWAGNNKLDSKKNNYYWTILRNTMCGISRKEYEERMGEDYLRLRKESGVRNVAWYLYKANHLVKEIPYENFKEYVEDMVLKYSNIFDRVKLECTIADNIEETFGLELHVSIRETVKNTIHK